MQTLKLLDVSLRDGGHRTNFHFEYNDLEALLVPLDSSGIDYIEIGYRNGSLHPIPNIGPAGLCAKDYLQQCLSLIKNAKIVVMLHSENVNDADLKELKDSNVNLIRICVIRGGLAQALPLIDKIHALGMAVSLNFIHTSQYLEKDLDEVVAKAVLHKPDMIYFADSNGSLMPQRVKKIYEKYVSQYPIPFGFHAHDNLGLALANTIEAINAGAQFVDSSLAGMGKGIGNLKTEFFTAYLHANKVEKYQLERLLLASNYARRALHIGQEEIEMDEFTRGISDLSTAEVKLVQPIRKA